MALNRERKRIIWSHDNIYYSINCYIFFYLFYGIISYLLDLCSAPPLGVSVAIIFKRYSACLSLSILERPPDALLTALTCKQIEIM